MPTQANIKAAQADLQLSTARELLKQKEQTLQQMSITLQQVSSMNDAKDAIIKSLTDEVAQLKLGCDTLHRQLATYQQAAMLQVAQQAQHQAQQGMTPQYPLYPALPVA
jgi:chlorite dismutase